MRICLVLPYNTRRISPQPYYMENLGIQYVASHLQSTGIDCRVIVADGAELSEAATLSAVMTNTPTLVGFAPSVDTSESVFRMCETLRRQHPQVMICLGGQHATFFAQEILEQEPCVDFVVMGEGEETMTAVCKSLETGEGLPQLNEGLAYRRGHEVIVTSPVLLRGALDRYPNPERTVLRLLADRGDYAMPMILTSRGCPYRCTFCSSHNFFGGAWRTRTPKAVVDEMESICENFGFAHFYFVDDQILGRGLQDKGHLMGIVSEVLRRNLHQRYDLYSFVMMRADFHRVLTEQELLSFRLAGFKDIFIGFESGSDEGLKLFAKGFRGSSYADTVRLTGAFFIEGGFILFHPYATVKTLLQDAALIKHVGVPSWSYYSKRLVPYPGTKLFEKMRKDGTLVECSHRKIKYELQDKVVRSIYEAVTSIEREIGVNDEQVFEVVDAFQKVRLRDAHHCGADPVESASRFSALRSRLQMLVEHYYESFVEVVSDPESTMTQSRTIQGCARLSQLVLDEYAQLVRDGRLSAYK